MDSVLARDKRHPNLPHFSTPAGKEHPSGTPMRLCRPSLRSPSTPFRVGNPPLALAAPAGVGQGQGVFVSKHSKAIQKRRKHHEEVS